MKRFSIIFVFSSGIRVSLVCLDGRHDGEQKEMNSHDG
jgi:hypothetical protein